ncbi:MAG: ABC transporter permease [Lachnospiraceae bacterium]
MRSFWKHVLRSCIQNIGTMIGAACIIALGIFIYVAMLDTLMNLQGQVERYYQTSNMADVFAEVGGITAAELKQLKDIPGIAEVSGKMTMDVRMLSEGQTEIVTLHLMSYDESDPLNQMRLSVPGIHERGIYIGGKMTASAGFESGTSMTLLLGGNGKQCVFEGICYAPDYIYAIPPGGTMIPDGEIYDIACMDKKLLEELTGKRDSLNELGFKLEPGYSYEDVRYQLMDQLQGKGLTSLCARSKQQSYDMVAGEMDELISMGTMLPVMFLSISIFMLYVVLKKMIDKDQSLIGTVKAMGMRDGELIGSYMMQGVCVGIVGALIGSMAAIPFGKFMFNMYADFFDLPDRVYHSYPDSRVKAFAIAIGVSMLAVYMGVRGILEITPAQAMRSRAPKAGVNIKLSGALLHKLGMMERMGLRSITRNPFRGFLIMLAICFPYSMSSVLFSFDQVANQMFFDQFSKVQVYDMQISLADYVPLLRAANAGYELDGVVDSEAVAQVVVELKHENRTEFAMLYGLNQGSSMWKIMDMYGNFYQPPDRGLYLNTRTAQKLHLQKGDLVEVSSTGITAEPVKLPVLEILDESLGSGCYISNKGFAHYFNSNALSDTIILKLKPGQQQHVKEQLLKTSQVTWLIDARRILENYESQMESMMVMVNMFSLMAVLAGGILIYNISMINIRERTTEFGTIMLMGGSDVEVGRILVFEQLLYFVMGILAGFPGSMVIKYLVEQVIISESYTLTLNVGAGAYFRSLVICFLITVFTCIAQLRIVRKIPVAEVLKERE